MNFRRCMKISPSENRSAQNEVARCRTHAQINWNHPVVCFDKVKRLSGQSGLGKWAARPLPGLGWPLFFWPLFFFNSVVGDGKHFARGAERAEGEQNKLRANRTSRTAPTVTKKSHFLTD